MSDELTAAELLSTMDAKVWAEQFMLTFKSKQPVIDEGFMLAWFANAIMAAHDITSGKANAQLAACQEQVKGLEQPCDICKTPYCQHKGLSE